ncbi:hypothetical protein [Bacillus thuringiensis]|uniref:hypothetical protein n=1 Tax=Bacillus thuringiensis TaxID=1428 RepID=UPI0011A043AC|nr:hypothetical protein [Bacillus thuringiensis]
MENKYKFTLVQDKNENLKAWRVTDFVDKISYLNYKKEIMNEIQKLLDGGVKSQQIIIFDKSFSIHKQYEHIGKHSVESKIGVKNLYHLGKPIPLYPNEKIYKINHIFEAFSNLYKDFNAEGVILNKDNLNEFIKEAMDNTAKAEICIKNLKIYINECSKRIKDKKKQEVLIDKCEKTFDKLTKKNKKINDEINEYILMEKISNGRTSEQKDRYNTLQNKYIDKFGKLFVNNVRPIVAVFYEESNLIEILGTNFIKQNAHEEKQIDLKEVRHNSPFTICFVAGYVFLNLMHQVYVNKVDKDKLTNDYVDEDMDDFDLEAEHLNGDEEVTDTSSDELSTQTIEKWINIKKKLELVMQEEQEQEQEQEQLVASIVVEQALASIETKLQGGLQKNFEVNGFMKGTLDVEIVE